MAKKQKLTPWFPAFVKPAREGMYRVRINGASKWARWERAGWFLALKDFERARKAHIPSNDCRGPRFGGWRGLAEPLA